MAQTSRGTVTGIVADGSGALVAGATVDLTHQDTNVVRSTKTNETGFYRFDAVDLGDYSVTVKQPGFQTLVKRSIPVLAGQTVSVDLSLEVGETQTTVEVIAQTETALQYEAPVRGGNFSSRTLQDLPLFNRRAISMAFALPGVTTNRFGAGGGTLFGGFAVNGMRQRSNNFMIDGSENNDISVTGEGMQITNPDAVSEVNIQTSNFDAEFGRSGGAIVNVITKSGTNNYHGTLHYLLDGSFDDAITNTQALNADIARRGRLPGATEQWYGGTFGGPVIRDRTFFFGSYQEQRRNSANTHRLITLSAAGRATLNSLFPQGRNFNVDMYNTLTSNVAADQQFFTQALGAGRPDLQFGTAITGFASRLLDRQFLGRIDHRLSDNDQLSGRYIFQDNDSPKNAAINVFPGTETSATNRNQNVSLTETHTFRPTLTNELRLNYNRLTPLFPADVVNTQTLNFPFLQIDGLTSAGLDPAFPQGRLGNNYSLQDTVSHIRSSHSFRFGADILRQRSKQFAPIPERGVMTIRAGGGFESFANFIDDFAGSQGQLQRTFGSAAYYPSMWRTAFFGQDRWRATPSLTLTLGLRWEYFGVAVNSLTKASWSGLFNIDPQTLDGPYRQPSKIGKDLNNFSPSLGIAYSPDAKGGMLAKLFGAKKTVIRTGFQMGYDSFFNNIASNAQTGTPNVIATLLASTITAANPRGVPNAFSAIPTTARNPSPSDAQTLVAGDLVNPYVMRWSLGVQRELPLNMLLDVSYVGSRGVRLFATEELNPPVPSSLRILPANVRAGFTATNRLDNLQGARDIRTNGASSNFNSLQTMVARRLGGGLSFTGSYTWSKTIDNMSDLFNLINNSRIRSAVPSYYGGMTIDRGVSVFDRTHRAVFQWTWALPWMKAQPGALGRALGGWQVASFTTFETGVPLNVVNGLDPDGLGTNDDRPMINPAGRAGVRAQVFAGSPTGYRDPENGNAPIDPATARYIGLAGHTGVAGVLPTGNAGRNTERMPGIKNFDFTVSKNFRVTEALALQFRTEFFNFFNTPQYGLPSPSPFMPGQQATSASVSASPAGRFLRHEFVDGGARSVRYQLKLIF